MSTEAKDLYEIGEAPPLGQVPPKMYASLVRRERFGAPRDAFKTEVVDTPEIELSAQREAGLHVPGHGSGDVEPPSIGRHALLDFSAA